MGRDALIVSIMDDTENGLAFMGKCLDVFAAIVIGIMSLPFVLPVFLFAWTIGFIKGKIGWVETY